MHCYVKDIHLILLSKHLRILISTVMKMNGQRLLNQSERKLGVDTVQNLVDETLNDKVKQAMYQKGIPFERIDQFIEKKENEEDGD